MPPEMCALRASPRLTVFRPFPLASPRPTRQIGPSFFVGIVTPWRAPRRRAPWMGMLAHGALLAVLAAGLIVSPLGVVPVAGGEIAAPAPLAALVSRPQVDLEPFALWWSLMGNPSVAFADPTLDEVAADTTGEDLAYDEPLASRGKVSIPWRSQLDGSAYAGSNCGPASLGMILDGFGIGKSTYDLRYRSHTYQGTWGSYTGTALENLARVADDLGVSTRGLYDGRRFRTWSIAELREELRQGHPVIILVKYRLLPGHIGSRAGDDHYIVVWDLDGDDFVYNDPAFTRGRDGYARVISAATLERATSSATIPGQAVAFLPPKA
jgi:hypothetical protein